MSLNVSTQKRFANPKIAFADRRCIDPPPVVELRVIETLSYPMVTENDITSKADYLLHVTLESLQKEDTIHDASLLMGEKFTSIAHVRSPYPAGVFVFSDLAVRVEGHYYLKFSLFEKQRLRERSDGNFSTFFPAKTTCPTLGNSNALQTLRFCLEVKSRPFMVFIPKSFPGLLASTSLSHILAEQGCRVRLRGACTRTRDDKMERTQF